MEHTNTATGIDLLSCPLCGSEPRMQTDGESGYWIECTNSACGCSTNIRIALMDDVRALLAEQWNRRAEQTATGTGATHEQLSTNPDTLSTNPAGLSGNLDAGTGDAMTERKAADVIARTGMKQTGVVLQNEKGDACIIHLGAVRWLSCAELAGVVHPTQAGTGDADERAVAPADVVLDLREYASNPGYSHSDYADTMRQAAHCIEGLRAMIWNYGAILAGPTPTPVVDGAGAQAAPSQPEGEIIKCHSKAGSDYCAYCGRDMCGTANDPECPPHKFKRLQAIKPEDVAVFGCSLEAKGLGRQCETWCNSIDCPFTLKSTPAAAQDDARGAALSDNVGSLSDNALARMERAEWFAVSNALRDARAALCKDGVRHTWLDGAVTLAEERAKGRGTYADRAAAKRTAGQDGAA